VEPFSSRTPASNLERPLLPGRLRRKHLGGAQGGTRVALRPHVEGGAMFPRSTLRLSAPVLLVALGLGLVSCGGGDESPTSPTPPPYVSGLYSLTWALQVLRKSDGFQKQFYCYGQMTLSQGTASASTAPLSGFAAVTSGCAPESYDLRGTVNLSGAVEFTTNGPKPPEGPCPGGKDVRYSGQITSSGDSRYLSARGVTTVACPQFGEHEFTYLISGWK
jgi:hypothetical protein